MTQINDIKKKLSISKVLLYYGCKDNGPGQNFGCIRHKSVNNKSISISNDEVCCCVSPGCDLKGDIFSIIALFEGLDIKIDFKVILNKACDIGGMSYQYDKIDPGDIEKLIRQDIIKEANMIFYKETKKHLSKIKDYIFKKRNITEKDLERLELGFLPKDEYNSIVKKIIQDLPQVNDIYYFDEGDNKKKFLYNTYYTFINRIIHPHFFNGDILYFTGETTPEILEPNSSKYFKMNANFAVYGHGEGYLLDSLNSKDKSNIIIAEGYWDALKIHLLGFSTVTFGTCKISDYFIDKYFHRLKLFNKIITCFDTEENKSGLYGAIALNKKLLEKDIENIYISVLPKINNIKVDVDSFITDVSSKFEIEVRDEIISKAEKFYSYLMKIIENADEADRDDLAGEILDKYNILSPADKIMIEKRLGIVYDFNNREIKRFIKETIKLRVEEEKKKKADNINNNENNDDGDNNRILTEEELSEYKNDVAELWKVCPYFFDDNNTFWIWDKLNYKWKITDDTNLLIKLDKLIDPENDITVNTKKVNYINALKYHGRVNYPKEPPKEWVQFKDKIFDIKNNEIFNTTHEYYFLNPIPYTIGKVPETPFIDRLFSQWVDLKYKDTLYEIMAYCLYRDVPIQVLFCFVGAGANGKSKYLNMIRKYLGADNTTSSNFSLLTGGSNAKFETSKMYRKLACFISETDFMEQKETTQIKTMTGGDALTYEYKGKNPFSDFNYTKLLIATNSIPSSRDTTLGFYRRWIIINFPNIFKGNVDVLKQVPEIEYENLSLKLIKILKKLLKKGSFTSEGSIEEKKKKYIAYSDPIIHFIKNRCNDNNTEKMPFFEFYDIFISYLEYTGKRIISKRELSVKLRNLGYEIQRVGKILPDGKRTTWQYIMGLDIKKSINKGVVLMDFKSIETMKTIENLHL